MFALVENIFWLTLLSLLLLIKGLVELVSDRVGVVVFSGIAIGLGLIVCRKNNGSTRLALLEEAPTLIGALKAALAAAKAADVFVKSLFKSF